MNLHELENKARFKLFIINHNYLYSTKSSLNNKGGISPRKLEGGGGFAVTVFMGLGISLAHSSIFAHIFRICHRHNDSTSF